MALCFCAAAACLFMASAAGAAGPHELPIRKFAKTTVAAWISEPSVIKAIKSQNKRHAKMKQAKITALDKQWRAETSKSDRPLIDQVLANSLSRFLAERKGEQHGVVTEVFIMDNKGLNVGQSDVTSDYWQGDEAKWKKTYLVGPNAVLIDEIEFDESTQTFQTQLSMAIADQNGAVIGAITVGIDVEAIVWASLDN